MHNFSAHMQPSCQTYRVGSQKGNMKYVRMCTRATITTHIERASSKVDGGLHAPIIKVQTEIAVRIKFSSGTKSECVKKSQRNRRRGGLGWGRGVLGEQREKIWKPTRWRVQAYFFTSQKCSLKSHLARQLTILFSPLSLMFFSVFFPLLLLSLVLEAVKDGALTHTQKHVPTHLSSLSSHGGAFNSQGRKKMGGKCRVREKVEAREEKKRKEAAGRAGDWGRAGGIFCWLSKCLPGLPLFDRCIGVTSNKCESPTHWNKEQDSEPEEEKQIRGIIFPFFSPKPLYSLQHKCFPRRLFQWDEENRLQPGVLSRCLGQSNPLLKSVCEQQSALDMFPNSPPPALSWHGMQLTAREETPTGVLWKCVCVCARACKLLTQLASLSHIHKRSFLLWFCRNH